MQKIMTLIAMAAILIGAIAWMTNSSDAVTTPPDNPFAVKPNSPAASAQNPHKHRQGMLQSTQNTGRRSPILPPSNNAIEAPETTPEENERTQVPADAADSSGDLIQLAILLDCSGSMDGLITQAQAYLWNIVNELSAMQREQRPARLELALYAYGLAPGAILAGQSSPTPSANNSGSSRIASTQSNRRQTVLERINPSRSDYLQQLSGFTKDLEGIADKLFALTTSGSEEYCATVIQRSLDELSWNMDPATLRLIVIAGNETFTQGRHDYRAICSQAAEEGAFINTVFCGDCSQGVQLMWRDAALRGGGSYNCIDHNDAIQDVATPYDAQLEELNQTLNDTYIAFSSEGASKKQQQIDNDRRTRSLSSEQALNRAMVKSSDAYDNSSWDLVDALKHDKIELSEESAGLPDTLQNLPPAERKSFVEQLSRRRTETQQAIRELGQKRSVYLSEQRAQNTDASSNLSEALINSLREQASARGYKPQ